MPKLYPEKFREEVVWFARDRHDGLTLEESPPFREQQLKTEVADPTSALGKAAVELGVWKWSAKHRFGLKKTSK